MKTNQLPVVECTGSPREMGRMHGEALRAVIAEKIGRWHLAIEQGLGEAPESFLRRFLDQIRFKEAIAAHTPHLLAEVEGIAEGAAIDPETAFAMQLMDEEWWFSKRPMHGHCSSVGIAPTRDGPAIMGQTMDLPEWHDGAQALLRMNNAEGGESLVFTSAGMIGLMGLARSGIGVCVNTLSALASSGAGLPVAFVMRGALGCGTVDQAARFLAAVPHASGQNYQLGDQVGVRCFECSADGAGEVMADSDVILHTNHPLVGDSSRAIEEPGVHLLNSQARLASLQADLGGRTHKTVDSLKAALEATREGANVSIEANGNPLSSMTIGAVVYEMCDAARFWIASGPPNARNWCMIQ